MNPRYPIYIISKGRWESRLTSKALEKINVPYRIAVEPQEYEQYAKVIDPSKILTLPFSNLGQGSIPARNFVWEHAISTGAERHWILDDNIRDFCRLNRNIKPRVASGTIFKCMEDFVDRYENVALAGPQYFMFTPRRTAHPAFTLNTRIYSCILIKNDLPYRWRGKFNEDTDLSLNALKDGWVTVLFYMFIQDKMATMTVKGGNLAELYQGEGRLEMAKSLVEQHPDCTRIYWRWHRWQHIVDYSSFKRNQLILKPGVTIPEGVDNYGMELAILPEVEVEESPGRRTRPTATVTMTPVAESISDNSGPLPSLEGVSELGFDTETTIEPSLFDRKIVGISYYLPDGRKGYVPIRHPGGGNYDEQAVRRWVQHELRGKKLIGANSKYEVHMMRNWGVDLEEQGCEMRDVFHQGALLNEKRYQLNLSLIAREEFPDEQRIEANHAAIYRMPADEATPIAIEDAELAYRLHGVYTPRIEAEGLSRVLTLENDLVFATCEMERAGVYLDIPKLLTWQKEIQKEWEQRVMMVTKEVGFQVEPGSWKDMARLFDHLKLNYPRTVPSETHPNGCPSFSEEFLVRVGHPTAQLALEARQLASYKAKFLDAYVQRVAPDGRLFYTLHQLRGDEYGTITGRYSSSQSKDGIGVNIQQVATKEKQPLLLQRWNIRELFIPPPGRTWFSADASQIEYRTFAHYAATHGMGRLAEAYNRDPKLDFHKLIAEWTGLIRDYAKNVNFCKLYGGGAEKIAYMINLYSRGQGPQMTLYNAEKIVQQYNREFPEARRLMRMASQQAERLGYVRTILGRRRRFVAGDRFYSALNCVFQGTAADLNKLKVLELHRNRRRLDITNRMTIHDECDGDMSSPEVLPLVKELLNEQSVPMQVPILWDCGYGATWAEAH